MAEEGEDRKGKNRITEAEQCTECERVASGEGDINLWKQENQRTNEEGEGSRGRAQQENETRAGGAPSIHRRPMPEGAAEAEMPEGAAEAAVDAGAAVAEGAAGAAVPEGAAAAAAVPEGAAVAAVDAGAAVAAVPEGAAVAAAVPEGAGERDESRRRTSSSH
jgi:hypothetical protein